MMMDKPLCPYCGPWNGYPDGVEMLKGYNQHLIYYTCPSCDSITPGIHFDKESDVEAQRWEDALAYALRRFQPMQKPLTNEQMKERVDSSDPVYVITGDGDERWMFVVQGKEPPKEGGHNYPYGVDFSCVDIDGDMVDGDFYGMKEFFENKGPFGLHPMGWIAFERKPTDEERDAAKWEDRKTNEDH